MKMQTRRKFTLGFKTRLALKAIRNQESLAEMARKFGVSIVLISRWEVECMHIYPSNFTRILIPRVEIALQYSIARKFGAFETSRRDREVQIMSFRALLKSLFDQMF